MCSAKCLYLEKYFNRQESDKIHTYYDEDDAKTKCVAVDNDDDDGKTKSDGVDDNDDDDDDDDDDVRTKLTRRVSTLA